MVFRVAIIFAVVAVTTSSPIGYESAPTKLYAPAFVKTIAAPVYKKVKYEAPAEYDFSYAVHDEHTGDIKSQEESRKGDVVHGRYELIEPDGHKRIVEYTADDNHGFNAIVRREETNIRIPQPVQIVAPVHKFAYAAPITKIGTPIAPVIKYTSPVGHYSSGHESSHVTFSGADAHYRY